VYNLGSARTLDFNPTVGYTMLAATAGDRLPFVMSLDRREKKEDP
jgi:hypothetical protein